MHTLGCQAALMPPRVDPVTVEARRADSAMAPASGVPRWNFPKVGWGLVFLPALLRRRGLSNLWEAPGPETEVSC